MYLKNLKTLLRDVKAHKPGENELKWNKNSAENILDVIRKKRMRYDVLYRSFDPTTAPQDGITRYTYVQKRWLIFKNDKIIAYAPLIAAEASIIDFCVYLNDARGLKPSTKSLRLGDGRPTRAEILKVTKDYNKEQY